MLWLENYVGRKAFYLKVNYDPVTDYPTKILVGESSTATGTSINCEALTSTFFEDMRFTLEDGITTIPYWIESITGISPNRIATVWVKATVGLLDTKFYLYYGNPIATDNSNGNYVFSFFDDFNSESLDVNKWDQNSATTTISGSVIDITSPAGGAWRGITSDNSFSIGKRYKTKASIAVGSTIYGSLGFVSAVNADPNNPCAVIFSGINDGFYLRTGNTSTDDTAVSTQNNSTHLYEITWKSGQVVFYKDGSTLGTKTTQIPTSSLKIGAAAYATTSTTKMDWVFVSEYTTNEPSLVNSDSHEENYQWLKGWTYRRRLKIKSPTTKVNDVPIKYLVGEIPGLSGANMDCAGEGLPSFNDLRFTEDDGQTLIPHYIETITGTTPNQIATTWIRPSYINTDNTTFFMYFGNPGAPSTSSSGTTFSGTSIGMVDYTQKVITRYGDTTISSTVKNLGLGSIYFDGTGDYLTIPDSNDWYLGTDNFTMDLWVKFTTLPIAGTYKHFISQYSDDSHAFSLYIEAPGGIPTVYFEINWTWTPSAVLPSPSTNTWYHIAVVRSSLTNTKIYIQGELKSTYTENYTVGNLSTVLMIGARSSQAVFNGYMDEIRISKGIARWTENFTPPTQQYTPDQYTVLLLRGDNYWTPTTFYDESGYGFAKPVLSSVGVVTNEVDKYTKLLIHGHKYMGVVDSATEKAITTVGSVGIVSTGKTITRSGTPIISTTTYKFGNSSMYFPGGSSNYLQTPTSYDWNLGTGDFTVDMWLNPDAGSFSGGGYNYDKTLFGYMGSSGDYYLYLDNASGAPSVYDWNGTGAWSSTPLQTGVWTHLALVRYSGAAKIYINGVLAATGSFPTSYGATTARYIGGWSNTRCYKGYMDELRFSKGIARWTTDFTPPTAPYDTDSNTVLLLHGDGANNSTTFIDSDVPSHPGFGTPVYFPGNSNYLTLGASKDWNIGNGDEPFTIDFWYSFSVINPNGENQHLILFYTDGSNLSNFTFDNYYSNYTGRPPLVGSIITMQWPFYPQTGIWYHFAIVRENSYINKIYINGNLCGFTSVNNSIKQNITTIYIGSWYNGDDALYGYINELRISKGVARWTKNFTPPTGPYLTSSAPSTTIAHLPFRGRGRY